MPYFTYFLISSVLQRKSLSDTPNSNKAEDMAIALLSRTLSFEKLGVALQSLKPRRGVAKEGY